MELDRLDKKILTHLDRDARQSISALARRLRCGRDQAEYRIERLVERKIIRKFEAVVNVFKLGFNIYKTYIRLENDKPRVNAFVRYLQQHPRVYWLGVGDGVWDLVVCLFARDAQEFHEMHVRMFSEFNSVVLNFACYTNIGVSIYNRGHWLKGQKPYFSISGAPERPKVDALDIRILRVLCAFARMPVSEIAQRLDSTVAIVQYRIQRLERLKLIVGYNLDIDLEELGMLYIKTQFFLRNYEVDYRRKLRAYCDEHPNITHFIEQIGDCNIEIESEVANYEEYSVMIDELRAEHSKLIRNFHTIVMRKMHSFSLPRDFSPGNAGANASALNDYREF